MNELKVFQNSDFGELGVLTINGKEYFPATQCAVILGYKRPADAISAHCKGSVKHRLPTNGGPQEVKYIPEGDLYRLIIHSKLPAARRFEHWVFDEVLPELRKKRSYGNDINIDEVIAKTAAAVALEIMKQIAPVAHTQKPDLFHSSESKKRAKKYKYRTPSKIETLKPEFKKKVDEMIASGNYSCQQVANFIMNNCDIYISQMSVNRYKHMNFICFDENDDLQISLLQAK